MTDRLTSDYQRVLLQHQQLQQQQQQQQQQSKEKLSRPPVYGERATEIGNGNNNNNTNTNTIQSPVVETSQHYNQQGGGGEHLEINQVDPQLWQLYQNMTQSRGDNINYHQNFNQNKSMDLNESNGVGNAHQYHQHHQHHQIHNQGLINSSQNSAVSSTTSQYHLQQQQQQQQQQLQLHLQEQLQSLIRSDQRTWQGQGQGQDQTQGQQHHEQQQQQQPQPLFAQSHCFGTHMTSIPTTTEGMPNINNDTSIAADRLMIQSKVEPFNANRDISQEQSSSDDTDLWKVFDDEKFAGLMDQQSQPLPTTQTYESQQGFQQRPPVPMAVPSQPQQRLVKDLDICDSEPFILPSTVIPPSVLDYSITPYQNGHKKHAQKRKFSPSITKDTNDVLSQSKRMKNPTIKPAVKPQAFLQQLVHENNHSNQYMLGISDGTLPRMKADDIEYDAAPSPLQLASFGTQLVKAVHTTDVPMLRDLLSCGISPNPCNQFRDSILDLVCKRANHSIFNLLMDMGADIQVVDGFGRTPLHHACWASELCIPIVQGILERDPMQLFMEDKHGQTPLEYVRKSLNGEWNAFLSQQVLQYLDPMPKHQSPKHRRPEGSLKDPDKAIGVPLAALISGGSLTPEQLKQMDEKTLQSYKKKK